MAPRVSTFQRTAPQVVAEPDESPVADVEDDLVEYGYLQIDHYVEFKKEAKKEDGETWAARWVSLPIGTHVRSYSSLDSFSIRESQDKTHVSLMPLRSCMKQTRMSSTCVDLDSCDTMSTISTAASSSGHLQVHFADECSQDDWEDQVLDESISSPASFSSPLAEWAYIDRDICGFSLHEYNPDVNNEFASSPYGCSFLEELAKVEFLNGYENQMASDSACEEAEERNTLEERRLDKALLLAGVRSWCIHAGPEDIASSEDIYI